MHQFSTCYRYVSSLTNVNSFGIPQLTKHKFIHNMPISTTGSRAGNHNVYGYSDLP